MNSHYTYLIIDIATILVPLIFSVDKKVAFYKKWPYLAFGILVTGGCFIVWDILFTRWHIWQFNPRFVTGVYAAGLPVEEWLFFIVVPYACSFIYASLDTYRRAENKKDSGWHILQGIGVMLLVLGIAFHDRAYTCSTFCACGIACIILFICRRRVPLFRADIFLRTCLICTVPFFIVNGLLTSLPVVIYNDAENLGIRLYTIPVEDISYGMLLLLGTIAGMQWLHAKK